MKKSYLMLAAAAALFAACSSDSLTTEKQSPQTQDAAEQAIGFDAYLNRGTTRAGATGDLVTNPTTGKADLQTQGFGVFGYYTDNELYSESSKPNFFYNQQVSTAAWTYSPVKYWPNEFGSEAISEAQDKLTFFAYAPYVQVVPETGLLVDQTQNNSGIVALTRNTASGDPYVKYLVDLTPAKRVDLCWGVAKENFTSSVVAGLNNITAGEVYKNVSKPEVGSKIFFDFNHALAALNVQIDTDIDQDTHGNNPLDGSTKVYVRSVTFEGFAAKGMFNLNASKTTPKWYDLSGNNELTSGKVSVYDGRRDGSEGQVNASAANETPNDLNPDIIQNSTPTPGVPSGGDPVNLFNSNTATEPIFVIPVADEQLKVTIVYDVETADPNLAGFLSDGVTKGSTIENTITKSIVLTSDGSTPIKLAAGKTYTVKLHLGLTSVKFDASVTDWASGDAGDPWLPINNGNATILSFTGIAGAGGTQAYTFTDGSGTHDILSSTPAGVTTSGSNGSGTLTIPANTSVNNQNYVVVVKDAATPTYKTITINVGQGTQPLNLTATGTDGSQGITLASTSSTFTGFNWAGATFVVKRNGTSMTPVATYAALSGESEFFFDSSANKIFLGSNLLSTDEVKITMKMGDASSAETTVSH